MENLNKKNVFLLILFLGSFIVSGQTTIWSEDFESYTNGTQTGNGTGTSTATWSTNDTDINVQASGGSQVLRGQQTRNTTAYWTTNTINVSGFALFSISLDANSGGSLDANQDIFRIEYRIDGGSYVEVEEASGVSSDPIQSSYNINSLSGNTLELRITFYNTGGDEFYEIDNILVEEGSGVSTNDPPSITATGNQEFCPGIPISVVETISITDSDDTTADEVSVQISSGYVNGEDLLTLTGSHPSITASWSVSEGKLTLTGPATLSAFETAVSAVQYSTSGMNPSGSRDFSITVGDTNFLPSTGHYYEYISDVGIRWTEARDAAALRTYYGLQGYLATLTSQAEADFSGSQAQGVGWIGASDAAVEGDWRWVTGPEAGTPFWSGNASGSTTPPFNFAYWNGGEPNQSGNEDYAHITANSVVRSPGGPGSWNDLRNQGGGGAYRPQGYVVEYGGMTGDPVINVTAVTMLNIDNEPPTASNPTPITVDCIGDVPTADVTVVTDEADNCSASPTVVFVSDSSDGNSNPETITRTYSITDGAGNSTNVTQIITVNDTTSPTASNLSNIAVECNSDIPLVNINDITDEADNCSIAANIVVAHVNDVSDGATSPETIIRTYSVTDEAGNSTNVTQTITVDDNTDPVIIGCPSNITVNVDSGTCGAVVNWTLPVASDNCGTVTLTDNNYSPGDNFFPGITTVTYIATDNAGNSTTCSFTITVTDNEDPVLTGPSDISVSTDSGSCEAVVNYTLPIVTDNCFMGDGTFPVIENFEVPSRNDLINVCYQFIGTTVSGNNPLSGTTSMRTSNLISGSSRTLISPLVYLNGTGQLTFLHRIDRARNNNRITVSLVDEADVATVVFTEVYSNNSIQSEAVDISITGNYRIRIDFDTNSNATDRGRIDDLVIPGLKIADTSGSGACPAASFQVVQNTGFTTGGSFPIGTTTNTFEVTDAFGNTGTYSFDITVSDNEAPTASDPSGITVECTGDVPAADTTVVTDGSDNCGTVTVAFVGDSALAGSNPGIITRTYSITDAAGNVTNVEQAITVDDTTDPTIVCPSDIARNVDPGLSTAVVAYTAPVGTDNCGTATTFQIAGLASGSAFPTGTTTNTFEVTDGAGNTITCSFDVTVVDSEAPVIDCPPDIVQDTDAGACQAVVAYTAPVGTDNAPGAVTVQIAGLAPGSVFPIGTTTNTFEVTDSSGLTATCSFDVTIEDNEAPTASDPSGITVECTGDVPAADTTVVTDGSDNCGTVTVAFVGDSALSGSNPGIITRTYSVTDAAGNSINVEQAITVDDTTAPTGSAPPDVTVECSANIPAVDIAALTGVTDNCSPLSNIVMAHVGDVSDGNSNPETITRTYSITDEAGNGINVEQAITVDDTTDPTASDPSGITVECTGDVPAADTTVVTDGSDNCGTVTVAFVGDSALAGSNPGIITRTYSVTDAAGNVTNVEQAITVDDTTAPTASDPSGITVECTGDVPAADTTVVTDGSDNCGTVTVAFVGDSALAGSNPGIITRTYSVTDAAGNSINVEQAITVDDTTDPAIVCPSDIARNVDPGLSTAVVAYTAPVGTDNCGTATTVQIAGLASGSAFPTGTTTNTFEVTDGAGNTITCSFDVTVVDSEAPVIDCPPDIVQDTDAGACQAVVAYTAPVGTDNAPGAVTVQIAGLAPGSVFPIGTTTNTFEVTDSSGLTATCSFDVTIEDNEAPTASDPSGITVECTGDVPAADTTVVTDGSDNCGTVTVAFVGDSALAGSNPGIITRTYSVTDAAGNVTNVEQAITVDDTTAPTGSAPPDVTVECSANIPAVDIAALTGVTDNCSPLSNIVMAHVGDVSDGNFNPETITRTYSVTDAAGNSINVEQAITVDDTTAPTASDPSGITVECTGDVPAADTTVVTDGSDNCGTVTVAFVGDSALAGSNPGIITRTYSVTDAAGNVTNVEQAITVDDTTAPTGSAPPDVTVECSANIPAVDIAALTGVTDNCSPLSNIVMAHVGDVSDGNFNPETITRTYSITDEAGNVTNVEQAITVDDTTDPTASDPSGITVECTGDVPAADTTVVTDGSDNCGTVTVAFVGDSALSGSNPGIITRTYSVTDAAGNSINVEQAITVDDTTAPTGSAPPDVTVECSANIPAVDIAALTGVTDNCSPLSNIVMAHVGDVSDGNFNPETITRTYSITDEAGNVTNVEQAITVDDTTDPAIVCPSDIARNVDSGLSTAVVAYTAPVGTDNCGTATTVQIAGLASGSAFPTGTTTNTFEVTDGAGNTITCSFDVTVVDSEAPVIDCPPDIVQDTDAGACQAVVAYTAPVGTDNAPGAVTVQIAGLAPGSVFPIGTTTNTFEVTDSSGLTATCSFDVTIEDNEAPTASDPSGITVECTGDVPAADTTVVTDGSDNCGTVTVAFVGDSALAGSNPGIITRTYSVTDAAGNSINVEQAITVDDTTDPAIVCPSDIARNVDPGLSTAVVAYTAPVGTDNCGTATTVQIAGLASGSAFPTGTTTNTFEVTDGAGNTITCSFDVTVVDSEAPVIDCPPDIVQDTDAGACQAVVAYTAPVGTDNAPGAVTVQIAGLAPGSVFPIGTTTNTFEVTDSSGLTATCSFDVTIEDNEAPTASDPSGITVECTGDVPAADTTVVTDGSDNCGTVTVAFVGDSALAGSNPGIITRTYSVTDAAGNALTSNRR